MGHHIAGSLHPGGAGALDVELIGVSGDPQAQAPAWAPALWLGDAEEDHTSTRRRGWLPLKWERELAALRCNGGAGA